MLQVIVICSGSGEVRHPEKGEEGGGGGRHDEQPGGEVPLRDCPHHEDGGDQPG